ncbi:hypothetical protein TELCIR_09935 [Teladorsagia circumcincta]|uniref:SXP/RAL-2 family protein Ani s 5-like cation-binding domain-containing protein n=1 Tax=Teladorsagia circumcincta TaxID=45464 RepID=A0A2G9UFM8_TELCI|nr:hypothetical protein TELCIR_09935 [Teladorsagia circumcincta]
MNKCLLLMALFGAALCASDRRRDREDGNRDRNGGGDKERRGGSGSRRETGPPPQPFLLTVTEEARQEFFAISSKKDVTIREQKEKISQWAQKYSIEKQVEEFNANMMRLKEELKQNVTDLIFTLPSAAQQFSAVMDNEDQTPAERKKALADLNAENPQAFSVLKFAVGQFLPRFGPDRKGRMQNRKNKRERNGMRGGPDEKRSSSDRGRPRGFKGTAPRNSEDGESRRNQETGSFDGSDLGF